MIIFCKRAVFCLGLMASVLFGGCKSEDEEPFSGIKFSGAEFYVQPESNVDITATFYKDDVADLSAVVNFSIVDGSDSTGGASFGENSLATSAKSGETVSVKVGKVVGGSVKIKAECNGFTAFKGVCIRLPDQISPSDRPLGFASLGIDMSKMTKTVEVSSSSALKSYAKKGGYIIYVKGEIDMSEGMLPAEGSKSTNSTDKLDAFIADFYKNSDTKYTSYSQWLKEKTNVPSGEDKYPDKSLSNKYKGVVQVSVASNTVIIGKEGATIRGGTFSVNSGNVVIRNIHFKDAVDPFPEHQAGDGWNAQHDLIGIDSGKNIWIDRCTFEDTLTLGYASNGEKWQVYDGLCDMKKTATNITVSRCVFKNHDKTMLIGSGDSDGASDPKARKISLIANYWLNCGQRCPMVRNSLCHVLNNVYASDSSRVYSSQSSINARAGSVVCAESNWFGSVASPSEKDGTIYNGANSVFNPADFYDYAKYSSKDEVIKIAGAGK